MEKPLIHIGYHKTGTTWLQQHLFSNEELGYGNIVKPSERAVFSQDFILKNSLDFEVAQETAFFQGRIHALKEKQLFPVLSAERLSGAFQAGGYDSKVIAERLKQVLPEARILIVLREQRSMMYSAYVQYVRGGGPRQLAHYFAGPKRAKGFLPGFSMDHFRYHRVVKTYQALFGRDQVLVLPYELFRQDPKHFTLKIIRFSGLEITEDQLAKLPFDHRVNTGYSAVTIAAKRFYNRIFVDSSLNHGVSIPLPEGAEKRFVKTVQRIEQVIPKSLKNNWQKQQKAYIAKQAEGYFESSNKQLQELTGLDLAPYKYLL